MNHGIRYIFVVACAQFVFGCDSADRRSDDAVAPVTDLQTTIVNATSVISHDFGILSPKDMVEHTYRIVNGGTETTSITNVDYQCGCTIAEFSAKSMPPGGHIDAKVQFKAGMDMGDFVKQVKVKLDGKTPLVILQVVASVREALHVTPAEMVVSGSQDSGPIVRDFVVSKYTAKPWEKVQIACSHHWFSAVINESDIASPASTSQISLCQQWCLSVRVDPQNESLNEGLNHGHISIAGPEGAKIVIPVQFRLKPRYFVTPDQLVFYTHGTGTTALTKRIVVTLPNTADVEARSKLNPKLYPESTDFTVTSNSTEMGAGVWIIAICYQAPARPPKGVERFHLEIAVEGDEKASIIVPIKVVGEN